MPAEKKMETQFYEDRPNLHLLNMKKSMTLNLDLKSSKKSVLSTPDVQMLQLASPELEKFINQQGNICTTPTPTQFICPKNVTEEQSAFAQGFVEALQSLHESGNTGDEAPNIQVLQQAENPCVIEPTVTSIQQDHVPVSKTMTNLSCATTTCYDPVLTSATALPGSTMSLPVYSSSYSSAYTSPSPDSMNSVPQAGWAESHHHVDAMPAIPHIKTEPGTISEQPQTVPVFHAVASAQCLDLSPINMDTQERIKSERKRLRNRIAASKCRKRKLERISRLEDKVQDLKNENADLQAAATKLREQVCKLKEGVMEHVKCGCQVMLAQQLAF